MKYIKSLPLIDVWSWSPSSLTKRKYDDRFFFLESRMYCMEIYVTTCHAVCPLVAMIFTWKANEDAAACNKLDIAGMKKLTTRTRANSSVYGVYASFRWNNNEDPQTWPVSSRCKQEISCSPFLYIFTQNYKKVPADVNRGWNSERTELMQEMCNGRLRIVFRKKLRLYYAKSLFEIPYSCDITVISKN